MVAFLQLPWEKSLEAIFLLPPVTICLLLLKQLLGLLLFVVAEAVAWLIFVCCWKSKEYLESFLNRVVFSSRDQTWDSRFRE